MTVDEAIREIIRRCQIEPFQWGYFDCMLMPADYAMLVGHDDCARHLRGNYDDRKSCHAVTGLLRDPVGVFERCAESLSLAVTRSYARGDVGVVSSSPGGPAVGAVYIGGTHWLVKNEYGALIGEPNEVLKAWSIE